MTRNDPSYDFSVLEQRRLSYAASGLGVGANGVDTVIVVNGTEIGVPRGYHRAADEEEAPVKWVHLVKQCLVVGCSRKDKT